jgi:Protease II
MNEFGDLERDDVYECIRSYSPYQQRFPNEFSPTLITADYDHECAFQAIKFLAKAREQKFCASVLYKEFPTWTTEEVKKTDEFTFIIANSRINK